jgi:hypothetical protein
VAEDELAMVEVTRVEETEELADAELIEAEVDWPAPPPFAFLMRLACWGEKWIASSMTVAMGYATDELELALDEAEEACDSVCVFVGSDVLVLPLLLWFSPSPSPPLPGGGGTIGKGMGTGGGIPNIAHPRPPGKITMGMGVPWLSLEVTVVVPETVEYWE